MKDIKVYLALLLCLIFFCSGLVVSAEEEKVKISDKEYLLELDNEVNMFIGNKIPVSGEIGTKVFLTYTVEKLTEHTALQCGVIAALSREDPWPYKTGGGMYYSGGLALFEEGYTYVIRMERTADGFEYQCAKMNKEDEEDKEYVKLGNYVGDKQGEFQYFGVWVGGEAKTGLSGVLTHVRCYDENGKDLGILPSDVVNQANENEELLDVHLSVNHSYDFTIENGFNVAISNKKELSEKDAIVYMEYDVEEVAKDETVQTGLVLSDDPTTAYPHKDGQMQWRGCSGGNPLLRPGGKYFICFAKEAEGFKGVVQCTLEGETETFVYQGVVGEYDSSYGYYSLWLAEGGAFSCKIQNFKCYDVNGNNLGVQFNQSNISASHDGELEDYSVVQDIYYCEANKGLLVLEDKQNAYVEIAGVREAATYKIVNDVLTLSFESGKEMWQCDYITCADGEGNQYKRLKTSKITFVTGEETFVVEADKENGYRIEKPVPPEKEGDEFIGWYLGDQTEYDFESIVAESVTLYAKWRDGNGNEYLATGTPTVNVKPWIAIGISILVLAVSTLGCFNIKRKKKCR